MNRPSKRRELPLVLRAKVWLPALAIVLPLCLGLLWLDDFTELTPRHSIARMACLIVVFIAAAISGILGWRLATSGRLKRGTSPMDAGFKFLFVGMVMTTMLLAPATELIAGWVDFPPSMTNSSIALLPISKAHEAHGRGASWSVKFQPDWSGVPISYNDYRYMQEHLPPDHRSASRNEIVSNGYFCARVSLQKAGKAIRIMHSRWGGLAEGSIGICPAGGSSEAIILP